jgi:hypothetical protein
MEDCMVHEQEKSLIETEIVNAKSDRTKYASLGTIYTLGGLIALGSVFNDSSTAHPPAEELVKNLVIQRVDRHMMEQRSLILEKAEESVKNKDKSFEFNTSGAIDLEKLRAQVEQDTNQETTITRRISTVFGVSLLAIATCYGFEARSAHRKKWNAEKNFQPSMQTTYILNDSVIMLRFKESGTATRPERRSRKPLTAQS